METERNEHQSNWRGNADSDEPTFLLRGGDRHAAGLVRLWALLRHCEGGDAGTVAHAFCKANSMDKWARRLGMDPDKNEKIFEAFYVVATDGLRDHPEGFTSPCHCSRCQERRDRGELQPNRDELL
jgi:hypothetical protein